MRAPIIGAFYAEEPERAKKFLQISSRITHTDPRAFEGAWLIAIATRCAITGADFFREAEAVGWELTPLRTHLEQGSHPRQYAESMGWSKGISGFVLHTVPAALYCWLWSKGDYAKAVEAAIALGGDADTVGAIVGGIAGAEAGVCGLPPEWLSGIWDFPRSTHWMHNLGLSLAGEREPPKTMWPAYLLRTPLFIAVVLAHGFRRLLPPY